MEIYQKLRTATVLPINVFRCLQNFYSTAVASLENNGWNIVYQTFLQ